MNLNLTSNIFKENKSLNGGALYLKDNNNNNNKNNYQSNIDINNNLFKNNYAENFGGAIYSEYSQLYLAKTINNSIINNIAGVIGGGVYSPSSISKNLFDINLLEIEDNSSNGLISNYASKPSYIVLNTKINKINKIRTGDNFPLTFTLYDEFNQKYDDIIKYYPLLNIKIDLIQKDDKDNNEIEYEGGHIKYTKVIGNKCYFSNGKCELNEFRIYGIPNNYIIDIKVENYEGNIEMRFDPIEIKVLTCDKYYIRKYDEYGILYCEMPICNEKCPILSTAVCKPYVQELVNNKENNICECLPGWEGEYCERRKFVNFKKFNIAIIIFESLSIFLMILYTVFIIFNRNKRIVRDIGFYKILIFIGGMISIFISNYFITYTNSSQWMIYFIFKHLGIGAILFIIYTIISLNNILGIDIVNEDQEELEKASLNSMLSSLEKINVNNQEDERDRNNSLNNKDFINFETITRNRRESNALVNIINKKKENRLSQDNVIKDSMKKIYNFIKSKNSLAQSSQHKNENSIKNRYLIINVKNAHSFFIELICIYAVFIVIHIIFTIFAYFRNKKFDTDIKEDQFILQKNMGYWTYKSHTEDFDVLFNLIELIQFILIIYKGKQTYEFKLIFRITQHITSSSYIGVIFGPLINIIGFYVLSDMRLSQVILNFSFNNVAYWIIIFMFSWNIVRSIIENDGDNILAYYLTPLSEKCLIHRSYRCDCVMKKVEGFIEVSKKTIDMYRYCSKPFEIVNGKIRITNMKSIKL